MDVETEPANESDLPRKQVKPIEMPKDAPNHKIPRSKRSSRSRTPQKKNDDPKILHVSLKQVGKELNGQELKEEKVEERNGESPKIENSKNNEKEKLPKGSKPVKEVENGEPAKIESVRDSTSEAENDIEKPAVSNNGLKDEESTQSQNDSVESQNDSVKTIDLNTPDSDTVVMDPLVVSDEADPELQFLEENSDRDSPLMSRCVTRRSYTRNIPTPKTPKLAEQETDSEKNSVADHTEEICNLPNDIPISVPKPDNLNGNDNDSLDTPNSSTKVEVGSDSTRLNFSEVNITVDSSESSEHDEIYLKGLRDRGLSSRRPIRGSEDFRKRVLKAGHNKSDLNLRQEQVITGIKRKNRSMTPEEMKKIRRESGGYGTFFTSPFASIRNKLRSDLPSSTPELLGYKDDRRILHSNDNLQIAKIEDAGEEGKKSWCAIM